MTFFQQLAPAVFFEKSDTESMNKGFSTIKSFYMGDVSWRQVSNPISVLDITRRHT